MFGSGTTVKLAADLACALRASYEHQMMSTRKTAFNNMVEQVVSGAKMKDINLMLTIFAVASAMLTATGAGQDSWDLGSSDDWMSVGPVTHVGPYYIHNSDLSIGTQRFLNTYPNYYRTYNPAALRIGNYTPLLGYNPYFYDPQAALDSAVANHAFQKYLNNYYSRYGYYGIYP